MRFDLNQPLANNYIVLLFDSEQKRQVYQPDTESYWLDSRVRTDCLIAWTGVLQGRLTIIVVTISHIEPTDTSTVNMQLCLRIQKYSKCHNNNIIMLELTLAPIGTNLE